MRLNSFPNDKFYALPNSKSLHTTISNLIKKKKKRQKGLQKGRKTLWEKEKLLVTSDFSFYHSVFKRLVLQTRKNQGLFGKGLKMFQSVLLIFVHVFSLLCFPCALFGTVYFIVSHCYMYLRKISAQARLRGSSGRNTFEKKNH